MKLTKSTKSICLLLLALLPFILSENKLKFISEGITFRSTNQIGENVLIAEFNYPVTQISIITDKQNNKSLAPLDSKNTPTDKFTLSEQQYNKFVEEIEGYTSQRYDTSNTKTTYKLLESYNADKELTSLTNIKLDFVEISFYFNTELNVNEKKLYVKYSYRVNKTVLYTLNNIVLKLIETNSEKEKEKGEELQIAKEGEIKKQKDPVSEKTITNISNFKVAAFAYFLRAIEKYNTIVDMTASAKIPKRDNSRSNNYFIMWGDYDY
jgi:hypothetical protein